MNFMLENLLKNLISISKQRTMLPFYHKVSDEKQTFENFLYTPRKILSFKNDIAILNKYYTPISMQEFIAVSKSRKKSKQNYFHITFDDGLSNFYKVVAPILLKEKIPATVFVNSDFIDNKALFFRYKASLLFQFYSKSSPKIKNKYHDFFEDNQKIKEKLLGVNFNNKEILDRLANEINYSFEDYLQTEKPYLSSIEIEELIEKGFTVGAHSKNHPLYSEIPFETQITQTKDSLDWLIKNFNLDYKVFSFPFTDLNVSKKFFTKLNAEKVIDASFGTSGIKKDNFVTNFQRLSFEIRNENAENYLLKEYIKYFLKIAFYKNTMPRD
ncbi:polysaccharide deacetylase family protein [Polaribacter cellanae]|uniref:Polysaccharide deacetylase family protein n=1 Tax=Polaribacter cellanae TaxID=2818493 RepID=A0A975H7Z7_9FLAO|nr:polysaccharide deacetylase family protein [Polaribacter cellanae]QTE23987.1 polysaccharide deacetylase family protein [Polaribacter cellanae]